MSRQPWHVPERWAWASLGQVLSIDSNLVDPADYAEHPHIAPNHIESGTGALLPYTTIAEDKVTSPKHLFYPGQILYSKIRPYLAKVVRVDFEGLCSADMYPLSSRVHAGYVWRWLLAPSFTESASKCQGRTVLPKINQEALVQLAIPVPPLREQERISTQIERLLDRSRRVSGSLAAVPALLNQLRQTTLAAAFRGDLTAAWRAKGPAVEPADKLLERIRAERRRRWEEAELAKLIAKGKPPTEDRWKEAYSEPIQGKLENSKKTASFSIDSTGWTETFLNAVCDPVRGITYGIVQTGNHVSGGVPTVRCGDIKAHTIDVPSLKCVDPDLSEQYSRTTLRGGEVLIAIRGTVGAAAVAGENMAGMNVSREVAVLPVLEQINPRYVMYLLTSPVGAELLAAQVKGVAQSGINIADLRNFPVPLPPREEQDEIVRRLIARENTLCRLNQVLEELRARVDSLTPAILAKAFRGELVPQDPNDEPASVLLERLRAEAVVEPARKVARRKAEPELTAPAEPALSPKSASENAEPSRRRRSPTNGAATLAAVNPHPESAPARPAALVLEPPTRPAEQAALAFPADATPFLDLPADTQAEQVHAVLLGEDPLPREDAVRRAAELLRDQGRAEFQRLRSDGPLATAIDHAISLAIRQGRIDRPQRGSVRALARTPGDVPPALWRRAIVAAQAVSPDADPDTLVRAAATWLQSQVGLEFQRLRTGGHIDTALRQALNATFTRA